METAFRKGGLKDVALKEVAGELRFKSAEEYWSFMTECAPPVAGFTKADEPTRRIIEVTVLDLARKTSPDGKPRLPWSASAISGKQIRVLDSAFGRRASAAGGKPAQRYFAATIRATGMRPANISALHQLSQLSRVQETAQRGADGVESC